MLGRPRKDLQIATDIAGQISTGVLQPGNRLAAVKHLCAHYHTAQRTVEAALRSLVAQGLVETRRRSGCYVRGPLVHPVAARVTPRPAPPAGHLLDYLTPQDPAAHTLSVYVTETHPASLAAWQEVAQAFPGVPVTVLSCADGRLEDVLRARQVDLVHTTPLMLQAIGADRFTAVSAAALLGAPWTRSLLPVVQARLADDPPLGGVPVGVTSRYLFVNRTLAAAAGVPPTPLTNPFAWLQRARAAQPRLRAQGANALRLAGLHDLLWMCRAIGWRAGQWQVDKAAALRLFTLLHGSGFAVCEPHAVPVDLLAGRVLYTVHCSFEAATMLSKATFSWQAQPLPVAAACGEPGWLLVLGISRVTRLPQRCLELATYLTSAPVQRRFAALHGPLPVLAGAVLDATATTDDRLPLATVRQSAAKCTFQWPEARFVAMSRQLAMWDEQSQLLAGTLAPAAAVQRFLYYADCWQAGG